MDNILDNYQDNIGDITIFISDGGTMAKKEYERAYLKTHPWINFKFDTRTLDYKTWILCGEAKSKCHHVRGAPLLPDVEQMLFRMALVKGARATTAIEGNTLSEEEVGRRIEGELELPPSKEYMGKEIDNIVRAYNDIGGRVIDKDFTKINVHEIKDFNKMVLEGLPLEEGVVPGETHRHSVRVGNYLSVLPEDCEFLLERYVDWLNEDLAVPDGQELIFGILKAIAAHLYFVWIHPFGDGNGRTARLIEFQILLSVGVPAVSAHLLSNHYNDTRSEYYRQLDMSSKKNGDISEFVSYAVQGFIDGLQEQIEKIQDQQLYVHWINHVHIIFADKERRQDKRRRRLVLDLVSTQEMSVSLEKVRHISPKIAEMYANVSDKTVERDIEKLIKLDLVVKKDKKIRPKFEIMRKFLSPAINQSR